MKKVKRFVLYSQHRGNWGRLLGNYLGPLTAGMGKRGDADRYKHTITVTTSPLPKKGKKK